MTEPLAGPSPAGMASAQSAQLEGVPMSKPLDEGRSTRDGRPEAQKAGTVNEG